MDKLLFKNWLRLILSAILFHCAFTGASQVINAYARVTAISGTDLTISNVNQANDDFEVGQLLVLMQMQDSVIGNNIGNNSSFGNLSNILNAGHFEIKAISAINGNSTVGFTSGSPTTISLFSISGTYNLGANTRVQVISMNELSATNYATTGAISALDWNGTVGGVVVINVPDTFTINHNISANAAGFRGGSRSDNNAGPTCVAANVTRYRENNADLGFKGEGIYRNTSNTYNNARGHLLNGGGGGSDHNGGGAGGGHYTSGGDGGIGYNNCTTFPSGGLGGVSLSAHVAGNRIFMGGGGGGGQQNNTSGRDGGDGGGIVLIKAGVITTTTCAGRTISANGTGSSDGTNDGGGGGGAGGTVLFNVDAWNVSASCPIAVSANGGDGSSSLAAGVHAGGGGGGQGVVVFNGAAPTANVSYQTNNGSPGCGGNGNPCPSLAGSPSGTDSSGVISNTNGPLALTVTAFSAKLELDIVKLNWVTEFDMESDCFIIQRSSNGYNFENLGVVKSKLNSLKRNSYSFTDKKPLLGQSYYRLIQRTISGEEDYSVLRPVFFERISKNDFLIYPNPANAELFIQSENIQLQDIEVYDLLGKSVLPEINLSKTGPNELHLDVSNLGNGSYFIKTASSVKLFHKL